MRRAPRLRPEVETLESLRLLSSMVATPHHAVAAQVSKAALPNPLPLSGTLHGAYKASGTSTRISGTSSISPLGKVTIGGGATVSGTTAAGTMTLTGKQGKLLVNLDATMASQNGFSGKYVITGGTKALAGETGTGSFVVTLNGSTSRGKFVATFS